MPLTPGLPLYAVDPRHIGTMDWTQWQTHAVSGFSGYSGQAGSAGNAGTAGAAGQSGASGQSGYSGVSAYSGQSGYSGLLVTDGVPITAGINDGRLTLTSGTPVTTTDVASASTVYWTPYVGARIAVWSGSRWKLYEPGEQSLTLSGMTSGKIYDIFVWDSGTGITLGRGPAWASDSTRGTGAGTTQLTTLDGVLVNAQSLTGIAGGVPCSASYLGSLRATSATTTCMTARTPWLANHYHPVQIPVAILGSGFWNYTTHNFQTANNGNADGASHSAIEILAPVPGRTVAVHLSVAAANGGGWVGVTVAISLDGTIVGTRTPGTTVPTLSSESNNIYASPHADYVGQPGLGYHTLTWLEASGATGTTTWCGAITIGNDSQNLQSGITGTIWA